MATAISSGQAHIVSNILWMMDYIPFISSVKQIADLFFSHCWQPANPEDLPSYAYAYHQHLTHKDGFRYISIVPVLGNLALIIKDVYEYLTADDQERSETLEQFIEGCLESHNPFAITYRFDHQDRDGRLEICRLLARHAERGNRHASEYLVIRPMFGDPDCYNFIVSLLIYNMQYHSDSLIGRGALENLRRAFEWGNPDQRGALLSRATRIADEGRHDFMYLVSQFYFFHGDRISAMEWLERAARGGYNLAISELNWWRDQLPPAPPPIPLPVRPEDFVGTVPYESENIPNDIQTKADEITALSERFENLPEDVADQISVPEGYRCPISQEFMAIPIFDSSHPMINAANIADRNLRHLFDKTSLERVYAARVTLNCPTCRYPEGGRTDRTQLRIDTALQDQILEFLRRNVPAPVV